MFKSIFLWVVCVLLVGATLSRAENHASLPENAAFEIFDFLDGAEKVGSAFNEISGGILSMPGVRIELRDIQYSDLERTSPEFGVSWWEVFGAILVAHKVLSQIEDRDFDGAITTAGFYTGAKLLTPTALGSGAVKGTTYGAVVGLAVEMYLNSMARMLTRKAINHQIHRYSLAREFATHERILAGEDIFQKVWFKKNGWIFNVVTEEDHSLVRVPVFVSTEDRRKIFELANLLYEADQVRARIIQERERAIEAFIIDTSERRSSSGNQEGWCAGEHNVTLSGGGSVAEIKGSLVAPGNGRQAYEVTCISVSAPSDTVNTLAIFVTLGTGPSNASYDLFLGTSAIPTEGRPYESIGGAYDVGRGRTATIEYQFSGDAKFKFGATGNWFSAPGSTNDYEAVFSLR